MSITADSKVKELLQDVRMKDPNTALGVAVRLFLRHEQFLRLPFGEWVSSLNGHVQRNHYRFVLRGDEVVGYFGWCLTDQERAEQWLAGAGLHFEHAHSGDCMILNAWIADSNDVNAFILEKARAIGTNLRFCNGKRYYKDGRIRPVKLQNNRRIGANPSA